MSSYEAGYDLHNIPNWHISGVSLSKQLRYIVTGVKKPMNADEICRLGARKYFEDRGVYRNPYPMGSPEFNEFERGWMQSLKKHGVSFVPKAPHGRSNKANSG